MTLRGVGILLNVTVTLSVRTKCHLEMLPNARVIYTSADHLVKYASIYPLHKFALCKFS